MEKGVLTLAFLKPDDDHPWMNRVTARVSKHPFCHVKLVFDCGTKSAEGFSIQLGEVVSLRHTKLSNPGYSTLSFAMPLSDYKSIREFCKHAAGANLTFDNTGMYLATVHPGGCMHIPSRRMGSTFCSKIICEALQAGNVPETRSLCPSACTPSSLYSAFSESPSRILAPMRVPGILKM